MKLVLCFWTKQNQLSDIKRSRKFLLVLQGNIFDKNTKERNTTINHIVKY